MPSKKKTVNDQPHALRVDDGTGDEVAQPTIVKKLPARARQARPPQYAASPDCVVVRPGVDGDPYGHQIMSRERAIEEGLID